MVQYIIVPESALAKLLLLLLMLMRLRSAPSPSSLEREKRESISQTVKSATEFLYNDNVSLCISIAMRLCHSFAFSAVTYTAGEGELAAALYAPSLSGNLICLIDLLVRCGLACSLFSEKEREKGKIVSVCV